MPRVKTPEKLFAKVARLIKGYASPPVIADKLGKSPQTVRRRLENPEELTLGDLRAISLRLHIPKEEIMEAITW